ncbi:hypothetical protein BGX21_009260 [Mortierella sp. AD011]|nr:hypothetical protein BGX20_000758 [Mortierella sp. AD010]KAF9397106.1 hypothetical protein BGX21_009260 [Mortierella sp. AD011]
MDLGLERVTQLLEALAPTNVSSTAGSASHVAPHLAFPVIHVAGTNGKGSICAYLSSILHAAGFRVGRYNSPHLITPRDTIQINNQPISQADYEFATEIVKQKDQELNLKATSFELLTATAFYWFAYGRHQTKQERVDIAVIEVGVGGRLDATNIVPRPLVCVIASIGMDHGALLGNTIEEVTSEKAGIIKPRVPVVIAPQSEGEKVYRTLEKKAADVGLSSSMVIKVKAAQWIKTDEVSSSLLAALTPIVTSAHWAVLENGFQVPIPLLGDFQLENAATAITAMNVLRGNVDSVENVSDGQWVQKITDDVIRKGIKDTIWPGRLQWIENVSSPREVQGRILVDGAHNPAAAIALRSFVDENIASSPDLCPRVHWIMGFTRGKDIEEMFDILFSKRTNQLEGSHIQERQDTFSAVEFSPPEGMPWVSPIPAQEVCERLRLQQERIHSSQQKDMLVIRGFGNDLKAALEQVGREREGNDIVVLCGSLYLVADLFRLLE